MYQVSIDILDRIDLYSSSIAIYVPFRKLPKKLRRLFSSYIFQIDQNNQVIHGLLNNAGTFAGDYTGRRKVTSEGNEYSLLGRTLC